MVWVLYLLDQRREWVWESDSLCIMRRERMVLPSFVALSSSDTLSPSVL